MAGSPGRGEGSIASWLVPMLVSNLVIVVLAVLGLAVWNGAVASARADQTVATYADFVVALADHIDLLSQSNLTDEAIPATAKELADARRRFLAAKVRILLYGSPGVMEAIAEIGGADLYQDGYRICRAVKEMRAHVGAAEAAQQDIESLLGLDCPP